MRISDLLAATCWALSMLMIGTGLFEAAFGDHFWGLVRMLSGAVVFDMGVRLWNRQRDKEDSG